MYENSRSIVEKKKNPIKARVISLSFHPDVGRSCAIYRKFCAQENRFYV